MPAEQALSSPYGSKSLGSPVPTDQSGPQAAAGAQVPKMAPQPAPGVGATSPGVQENQDPFEQELQKVSLGKGTPPNPFLEADPNLPAGYTPLTPRLRRAPDGTMEHLRTDNGKWVPFGDAENKMASDILGAFNTFAVRTKEDLPRVIGAIAGTALAERMGLGPWAAAFLAGGSQAAAGAAADIAQNKEVTPGGVALDVGIGSATSLIPAGIGAYGAKKAAQAEAEAGLGPLIAKGGEELMSRQETEVAAAQSIGAKPGPTQTAQELAAIKKMGPEAQKLYQMQWGKAAQFKESLHQATSRLMGNAGEDLGIEDPNYYKVIGNVLKSTGETTGRLKGVAKSISGDQVHSIDPVLSQMRDEITKMTPKGANIFDDGGKINARLLADAKDKYPTLFSPGSRELVNVYNELYNVSKTGAGANEVGAFMNSTPADKLLEPVARQGESKIVESLGNSLPRNQPGLTLDEMDSYRAAFGKRANFHGITRDETNDAYARLHHTMSNHLDTKMIDILNGAGKKQESAQLMGAKDFYSGIKETAEDLQAKVAHDPENAARSLIDVKNPAQVKQLWTLLTPEQQNHLSGSYLNTLLDPAVDEVSGKMKIASAENAWSKVDPKVKEIMYGKEGTKQINQMINYAKGINLKAPTNYNPDGDPLMSKFLGVAHARTPTGAMNFMRNLFSKNTKAQDFVTDKLSGVLMPTGEDSVSLAKKQQFMNRMSQAMVSRWTRYGVSPAVSSELETPHAEPSPIPQRSP